MSHRLYLRVLSIGIASLIVVQTAVAGQTGAGLAIQILEASAGQNLIAEQLPPIKVRVLDRTGRAIPGANVLFTAPEEGATGHFLPNENQITVATDNQGMATAPRFQTNSTVGDYQIQIIASYRDSVSRAVIPQSNVLKKKSSSKKIIILSALIGGAAAAAFAGRGNNAGPASSALGALAVTPAITLGGESSLGLTPAIFIAGPTSGLTTSGTSSSTSTGVTSGGGFVEPITDPVSSVCARSNRPECR